MKIKNKVIVIIMTLIAAALLFTACSKGTSPYKKFDKRGYTVSVRYDSNGGQFANSADNNIVDVFPIDLFENGDGVKLIEPGDSKRGDGAARSGITRTGYFLAGWYRERTLRVDESGNPLDENGLLTSETGKEQGYSYSGKWDFENDKLSIDPDKKHNSSEVVLTLYPAWIPNFTYEFYAETGDKDNPFETVGSYTFNPLLQANRFSLDLPEWNLDTGAMDYGDFPKVEEKTFDSVYSDKGFNDEVTGEVTHKGVIDYEHGVATNVITGYYGKWLNGEWYKISTAQQLIDNVNVAGCYEILANLDFSDPDLYWPLGFAQGDFTGKIIGGGHIISGVTASQMDFNTQMFGGLFGRIMSEAVIENVTFENATYRLLLGTRLFGTSFGMFAGYIAEDATIKDVTVSGTLEISDNLPALSGGNSAFGGYTIGLLCGNGYTPSGDNSINWNGITCSMIESEIPPLNPVIAETDGNTVHLKYANE